MSLKTFASKSIKNLTKPIYLKHVEKYTKTIKLKMLKKSLKLATRKNIKIYLIKNYNRFFLISDFLPNCLVVQHEFSMTCFYDCFIFGNVWDENSSLLNKLETSARFFMFICLGLRVGV